MKIENLTKAIDIGHQIRAYNNAITSIKDADSIEFGGFNLSLKDNDLFVGFPDTEDSGSELRRILMEYFYGRIKDLENKLTYL